MPADRARVRDIIAKSMAKQPLAVEETAVLLAADQPELVDEIFDAARQLKRDVYGNRIVIFAPLYIGNECNNDCQYCLSAARTVKWFAARSMKMKSARKYWPWKTRGTSG